MVDVVQLTSGKLVQATDPADWLELTSGKRVRSAVSPQALQLTSGKLVMVDSPAASLDCCEQNVCSAGETGDNCNTLTKCNDDGEHHRVQWDHTDCSDASHHIAIHRSTNGGSFVEVADDISCDNADPDAGCCGFLFPSCTPDGIFLFRILKHDESGKTTDYQYRVRIENDGGDTLVGSACTATGCTDCGGDTACFEA